MTAAVMSEPAVEQHYSVSWVAARLSVNRATVYRLIAAGELKAVRVGDLRIPESALLRYLEGADASG